MFVVPLNRRFLEWGNKEPADLEMRYAMGLGDGGLGWSHLVVP
jgi:hypothetical protein